MTIRWAGPADAEGIATVQVAAWRAAYRGLLPGDLLDRLSVDGAAARWEERIARPWGHVLVAEQGGRIVGFAACGGSEDADTDPQVVGEIYVLYVHPEKWRQGFGAALLDEALEHLRGDRFEEAMLWVLRGHQQGIGFYEAAGFEADGASRVRQRRDGSQLAIVCYRRRL